MNNSTGHNCTTNLNLSNFIDLTGCNNFDTNWDKKLFYLDGVQNIRFTLVLELERKSFIKGVKNILHKAFNTFRFCVISTVWPNQKSTLEICSNSQKRLFLFSSETFFGSTFKNIERPSNRGSNPSKVLNRVVCYVIFSFCTNIPFYLLLLLLV